MTPLVAQNHPPPPPDHQENVKSTSFHSDTTKYNGILQFQKIQGKTVAVRNFGRYPVKFLNPTNLIQGKTDVIVMYMLGYGGGLVAGDTIQVSCQVEEGCRVILCTQSSTKVFKSRKELICSQHFRTTLHSNALFAYLPDPVACFKNSRFQQEQYFSIESTSNLIFVDWMTSGRKRSLQLDYNEEKGQQGVETTEAWQFILYESFNQLKIDGRLIYEDRLLLKDDEIIDLKTRMDNFHVFGMMLVYGKSFQDILEVLQERGKRKKNYSDKTSTIQSDSHKGRLFYFVSPLGEYGSILRFGADVTETAYDFLKEMLYPLKDILGFQPYGQGR